MTTSTSSNFSAITHWASYGQFNDGPDDPKQPRATSADWGKVNQLINPVSIPWDVPVHKDDIKRLILGTIPKDMENKWFIYSEDLQLEDQEGRPTPGLRVHFHRSWTGDKMFELDVVSSLELDEQGCPRSVRVRKLVHETNPESVTGADEAWAKETVHEVCAWVLRVRLGDEGAQDVGDEE